MERFSIIAEEHFGRTVEMLHDFLVCGLCLSFLESHQRKRNRIYIKPWKWTTPRANSLLQLYCQYRIYGSMPDQLIEVHYNLMRSEPVYFQYHASRSSLAVDV